MTVVCLSVCLSVCRTVSSDQRGPFQVRDVAALPPPAPRSGNAPTTATGGAQSMASGDDPLVLADEKAAEARELLAKELFDPAIELLATALELRCMPALSRPARTFTL